MKKIAWLAGLILIIVIGYYLYPTAFNSQASKPIWDLIPTDAVIVYENKKLPETPGFETYIRNALKQDSVLAITLNSKATFISFHITGKEDFGMIYYQPDSTFLQSTFFKKLLTVSKPKKRIFEGYKISELSTPANGILSYTTLGANLVISRESFLIEDVIRSAKTDGKVSMHKKNAPRLQLPPSASVQGNLFINLNLFGRFCDLFLPTEMKSDFLKNFGNAMISEIKTGNQTLSLNGFAFDSSSNHPSALSLFNDQHPAPSEIRKVISNRALFMVHYGITDFNAWAKRREKYGEVSASSLKLRSANQSAIFYNSLGSESAQCSLPAAGRTDEIFLLQIKSTTAAALNTFLSNDLPPIENYVTYPIRKLTNPELIYSLLWPLTENKNFNFYCRYDKFLLFAETTDVLEKFLSDIEEDNTWGKSVEWNTFFNTALPENNVSLVFNGSTLFPWLLDQITPKWKEKMSNLEWSKPIKGSFQWTHLDVNYDFNGVLQFDADRKHSASDDHSVIPQLTFPQSISSVSLVKNHSSPTAEALVQTENKTVRLISADFKILFTMDMQEKISSEIYQIDFFKNKKFQYLFLAGKTIYLIDKLGKNVTGFPKEIKASSPLGFLSVVDYDNARNYRFMFADEKGNLYITDKNGKILPGWNGKTAGAKLPDIPRAVRVLGRDYIISVDVQGKIYAFNRKGESIKGFPVTMNLTPSGDWFFEKSTDGNEGLITVASAEGTKVQVNLKGTIVSRENFVRSSPDSKFTLIVSSRLNDYVMARIDNKKIAVLGRKGEVILEKENPGSVGLQVKYLDFDSGRKLFCFEDLQQDFTFIFDEKGLPVMNHPLETTSMPAIAGRTKEIIIFSAFKNQLRKIIP